MAEDVTSSKGPENPGASCNQFSELLHAAQKRKEKSMKQVEGWSPSRLSTQC